MRAALLALLLLSVAAAMDVDMQRETVHRIQPDLTDSVQYADFFYGDLANQTYAAISGENAYDFVAGRVPALMRIDFYSINSGADYLLVNITGSMSDFVSPLGRDFKLGGKGFIDTLCEPPRFGSIGAINQTFTVTIYLPENLTVAEVPGNKSADLGHLAYNLTTWASPGMVVQSLRLATKDAALADYCIERDIVDAQLKQGIIAASISDGVPNALQSILLFILLFVALLYLVRGRIF